MNLKTYPTITLHKGASSIYRFDFSTFDFNGGTVIISIKNINTNTMVKTVEITEPGIHEVVFEDDFTKDLTVGDKQYQYDIMHHVDGERFPQCLPSAVKVLGTVGGLE